MTALDWTTTEMLANADAHTIEARDQRGPAGDVPARLLRGLYEVDITSGTVQRRPPVLYPAGTL